MAQGSPGRTKRTAVTFLGLLAAVLVHISGWALLAEWIFSRTFCSDYRAEGGPFNLRTGPPPSAWWLLAVAAVWLVSAATFVLVIRPWWRDVSLVVTVTILSFAVLLALGYLIFRPAV